MRRPFDRLRQEMRRCDGYPWEQQARSPLQLIPPHPSLHSQGLPSSRCLLCSPSAKESHSAEGQDCTSWKGKNVRTRSQAVYACPSWRTFALPIVLRTLSEVATSEGIQLAVEARRAAFWEGMRSSHGAVCVAYTWSIRHYIEGLHRSQHVGVMGSTRTTYG